MYFLRSFVPVQETFSKDTFHIQQHGLERTFRTLLPSFLPSVLADDVEGAEGRHLLLGELAVVGLLRQRHKTDLVGVTQLHRLALILCWNRCVDSKDYRVLDRQLMS